MRILYVITKSNWGGAQKYVFELASAFSKDNDVSVALGGTGAAGAPKGALAEKLDGSGIRTIFIPSFERNISWIKELRLFADLVTLFKKERPDVVHLNSSKAGGTGALAARIAGVPKIVFTLHGNPLSEDRPSYQKVAIAIATWATILLSHTTIVITKKELDTLSSWPLISKKLSLIYNGIDPTPYTLQPTASPIRTSFPTGSIIVGTIGELHPNKNQIALVEAARTLSNNICFAIVGEGEERTNLETAITRLNLASRVKLFGFIPAPDALPAFDMFVLPSKKEGLPYVLLEAGLASLPVIASNVGGIPEIIEHDITGILVQIDNLTQLENAISNLSISPDKRNSTGTALREKVLRNFSFKKMLEGIEKLY